MNWIDVIFATMMAGLLFKGYMQGVKPAFRQLLGAIGASALTIFLNLPITNFFAPSFPTIGEWMRPMVAIALLAGLWLFFHVVADSMTKITRDDFVETWERVFGILLAFIKGWVFGVVLLAIVFTFPPAPWADQMKAESRLHHWFVEKDLAAKLGFDKPDPLDNLLHKEP
jgi:uncharacterized membrane protein required for colicin V production